MLSILVAVPLFLILSVYETELDLACRGGFAPLLPAVATLIPDLGLAITFPVDFTSVDSSTTLGLKPDGGGLDTDLDLTTFSPVDLDIAGEMFLELNIFTSPPPFASVFDFLKA